MSRNFWKSADFAPPFDAAVRGPRDIFGGDSAPAPDYTPMAAASKEAAEIGAALGREQLTESRRQYDRNMEVAAPVIAAQLGLMNQTREQGDDYYNYMREVFRPLERRMVAKADYEGSDIRLEEAAAQAAADARRGQTQQANMMARQGLRYGYSPARMAAMAGQMAGTNAAQVAGATTGARNNQRNVGWARQMDAAGLGRNLPGASQGAYGLALNSGNSAVANSMQPGGQLLSGMAMGAGTTMQGRGLQLQGLGNIMNSQTSVYNNSQQDSGGLGGILGAGLGAWGKMGFPGISDRRLKEDIVLVGKDARTGLNLYEWRYKYCADPTRFRGVMADEVESVMPDAVVYDDLGFASVNYDKLGIQMVEV